MFDGLVSSKHFQPLFLVAKRENWRSFPFYMKQKTNNKIVWQRSAVVSFAKRDANAVLIAANAPRIVVKQLDGTGNHHHDE